MRAATTRSLEEVETSTRCLLALIGPVDPTPDQVAAVAIVAVAFDNLRLTAERLKGE